MQTVDGQGWDAATRNNFYTQDQGTRLIPWSWMSALEQADGTLFMADSLSRYGYLPNPDSSPAGLPVGFMVARSGVDEPSLGMNCAACHTRQIEYGGKSYRIDGGPSLADLGAFWSDLDAAVGRTLDDPAKFTAFAKSALGAEWSDKKQETLRIKVKAWYAPFHAISDGGLPKPEHDRPWGKGRLDAVGMILNRIAGLSIGEPEDGHIIASNIVRADAAVRPPFLWNSAIQNRTQWPGFAENGNDLLALSRNLGQVYGVFGVFRPKKDDSHPIGYDYLGDNSANFDGLAALESDVHALEPPKWPWAVDEKLAAEGEKIFNWTTAQGGCVECHGIKPLADGNWLTPVTPIAQIRTDAKELLNLGRNVDTGVMTGAFIPFLGQPLKKVDKAVSVLGLSVRGAVLQHYFPDVRMDPNLRRLLMSLHQSLDVVIETLDPKLKAEVMKDLDALKGAYPIPGVGAPPAPGYEARVMQGIWAAAPYLHNGSVPSLAELLKPSDNRVGTFKVGPAYDPAAVGLAVEQPTSSTTLSTTGCENPTSGDSHCGHDFGVTLSDDQKKALLEYLKTL
nr:di-heme-cytochrome C peroxidase [Methylosinus sp. PW1]